MKVYKVGISVHVSPAKPRMYYVMGKTLHQKVFDSVTMPDD
jgi:hypothetical protein